MARSTDEVMTFLQDLARRSAPQAHRELTEVEEFSRTNGAFRRREPRIDALLRQSGIEAAERAQARHRVNGSHKKSPPSERVGFLPYGRNKPWR